MNEQLLICCSISICKHAKSMTLLPVEAVRGSRPRSGGGLAGEDGITCTAAGRFTALGFRDAGLSRVRLPDKLKGLMHG